MIFKTRGIVLSRLNYSESSLIVKIITEEFGLKTYIIKGGRKPGAKIPISMFQPLQILELEVYNNSKKEINNIAEVRIYRDTTRIQTDIIKSTIAIFLTEIISLSIREEEKNLMVYSFLENRILSLSSLEDNYSTFHLEFLIGFSEYLGFFPLNDYSSHNLFFNLERGCFTTYPSVEDNYVSVEESYLFSQFLSLYNGFEKIDKNMFSKTKRDIIFDILLRFYRLQIIDFHKIKSPVILKTILH